MEQTKQKRILLLIVCAFWFGQYVHIPYQVTYLSSLGYDSGLIGLVVGAFGLIQVVFRIPFGLLADHVGHHRKIIISGICCVAVSSIFRILIPNIWGYLIANLFSGFGASAWISYMVLYMSYYKDSQLQQASGSILAANNLGVFLGFLASSLTYAALGMKVVCALGGGITFVGFLVSFMVKENPTGQSTLSYRELLRPAAYRRLFFFAFLALLQQGVQMATVMSFTVKVIRELGAEGWQIGMCSIVYILFAVSFAKISTLPVFSVIGYERIIKAGLVIQLLYCILTPNMTSIIGVYLCQVLAAAAMGFLFTALTSESMQGIPANQSSTAMGIFQAVYAVGMTCVPVLVGQVAEYADMKTAYYLLAGLLSAGFAAAMWFYGVEKRKQSKRSGR